MRRSHLSLLVCLSLSACRADEAVAEPDAEVVALAAADEASTTSDRVSDLGTFFGEGDPHVSVISQVALSHDGDCGLSLDALGELRLWRSLDGKAPPLRVAVSSAQRLSVGCDGEGDARRWRIAVVDSSGGAKVFEAATRGEARVVFRVDPTDAVTRMEVMPDGRGYLATGPDGALRYFRLDGVLLDRIEEPRFRIDDLQLGREGRFVVSSGRVETAGPALEARVFEARNGRLEPQGEALDIKAQVGRVRWDLQRQRVWYVEAHKAGHVGEIRMVDLNDREATHLFALPASASHGATDLLDDGSLVVDGQGHGVLAISSQGKVRNLPMTSMQLGTSAWARGHRISAHQNYLHVEDPQGRSLYLGYRPNPSAQAALSPDGSKVAFAHAMRIEVEDQAGQVRRIDLELPFSGASEMIWWDEQTLLLFNYQGGATLLDVRSGEWLDQIDLHGAYSDARVEPRLGAVALRTQDWATRRLLRIEDRRFVEHLSVTDNGAFFGVLPASAKDPDAKPGLWTFDGHKLYRYPSQALREGFAQSERTDFEQAKPDPATSMVQPLADGRTLWLATKAEQGRFDTFVWVYDGEERQVELRVGRGNPTWMRPSPDGRELAVILTNPHGARSAYLVDLNANEISWQTALPNDALVEWAGGGEALLAQSPSSGVQVLSASSGEVTRARCGFEFEALPVPPMGTMHANQYLCG